MMTPPERPVSPARPVVIAALAIAVVVLATAASATGWSGIARGGLHLGPVAAVAVTWLVAALLQSTAAATLFVVAAAAAGWLGPVEAVWGVVGCNLGAAASATATGLGHYRRDAVFRRALAGSTADVVMTFAAGLLVVAAEAVTGWSGALAQATTAGTPPDSARGGLRGVADPYLEFLREGLALPRGAAGGIMVVCGAGVTLFALSKMRRALFDVSGAVRERLLHGVLAREADVRAGLAVGACTQSSAMTLASLVPLSASGLLDLHAAVSVSRAAAVGALALPLATSLLLGVPGVGVAHAVFNVVGLALCVVPVVRTGVTATARRIARVSAERPLVGLAMMTGVVFVIPLVLLGVA